MARCVDLRIAGWALVSVVAADLGLAQAPLWQANGVQLDRLGASIGDPGDVNGDGASDWVVGAPFHVDGAGQSIGRATVLSSAGSVLYELVGGTGPGGGDQLGHSVAGVGDVNADGRGDFVVGAPYDDTSGYVQNGTATLRSGSNGAVLFTFGGSASNAYFGWAVAGAGDVDGDGRGDVIVGSYDDQNTSSPGYARVHSGANGALLHTLLGDSDDDYFGVAVAGAGDVDGDGRADLVIGAPRDDGGGTDSGSVRVVSGLNGATLFTWNGDSAGWNFGAAVAGGRDVDGDGRADVIVGAPSAQPGVARVFSGASGLVLFTWIGSETQDRFGAAVSLGEVTGDARADLFVGAPGATAAGLPIGGVRLFSGLNGMLLLSMAASYTSASDTDQGFGAAVLVGGDSNGDGVRELAVGAPGRDAGIAAIDGGSIWVHSTRPLPALAYCTAKTNSLGCVTAVTAVGEASLAAPDDFHVGACYELDNVSGLMLWSVTPAALPFQGGTMCLAAPRRRTSVQNAGDGTTGVTFCSGIAPPGCQGSFDYLWTSAYMLANGIGAGDEVFCQFWSRDSGFAPPNNSNLTNALRFVVTN
jgi:hypothetical protein